MTAGYVYRGRVSWSPEAVVRLAAVPGDTPSARAQRVVAARRRQEDGKVIETAVLALLRRFDLWLTLVAETKVSGPAPQPTKPVTCIECGALHQGGRPCDICALRRAA